MKPINQIVATYRSTHAASVALGTSAPQMRNLIDCGALVDDNGQVWIKSKTKLALTHKKENDND